MSYSVNEGAAGIVTVCAVLGNVMTVGGSTLAVITSNFVLSAGSSSMWYIE